MNVTMSLSSYLPLLLHSYPLQSTQTCSLFVLIATSFREHPRLVMSIQQACKRCLLSLIAVLN
jgi:hypothetical protein